MLSQLMTLFGFFSLVLVGVYWVNRAVRLFDQLISDGQSAWVFLEFTALTLPYVIQLVLPLSAFVAAVYVTNRLSAESELVVMQATGFSPFRLARPVLLFGLIVAVLVSILAHVLVPASRARLADRQSEIAENITARFLSEGSFLHPADGITLFIREITPQGELRDLFLSDARHPLTQTTYTAESALLVRGEAGPKLIMFDGLAQTIRTDSERLAVTRFSDFTYDIGALVSGSGRNRRDVREFPTATLLDPGEADLALARAPRSEFLYEGHDRFAQPLLAVAAALIGFSALLLGGFSRFGMWRQIGIAAVMLIAVQALANAVADIAIGNAAAWPLTYLPVLAGGVMAAATLWAAGRPRRVRPPGALPEGAAA